MMTNEDRKDENAETKAIFLKICATTHDVPCSMYPSDQNKNPENDNNNTLVLELLLIRNKYEREHMAK